MTGNDLAELYNYLMLFRRTYDDAENEAESLCRVIRDIFSEQEGFVHEADAEKTMRRLKNPRNAGRKKRILPKQEQRIRELHEQGCSIRKISEEISIPKSTVSRILSDYQ